MEYPKVIQKKLKKQLSKESTKREEEKGQTIGLCAYRLEFEHPGTGKQMKFQIEPEGEIFKKLSAY